MFTKLLKHNLKPILKSILPFAIALLASVILFTATAYEREYVYETLPDGKYNLINIIEPSGIQQFIHGAASFATSCSVILLFAAAVRSVWRQFKTSFYSDRAYLTHTLPVSRQTLWGAEICSIAITLVSVILAIAVNCLILSCTHNGAQLLESFGLMGGCTSCVGTWYSAEPLGFGVYLSYAFLVFIELAFMILCGISGMILKHRSGRKIAITTGVGIYIIGCILLFLAYYVASGINPNLLNVFSAYPGQLTPGQSVDYGPISGTMLFVAAVYTSYCAVLYFVDQKLLQRGIDLD